MLCEYFVCAEYNVSLHGRTRIRYRHGYNVRHTETRIHRCTATLDSASRDGARTARSTRHNIKMWHDVIASTAAARRSNTSRPNVARSHRKRHTSAWLHVRQGALMATAPKTQMATPGDQRSGTLESWHWSARQRRGCSPALRALAGWAVPMPTTVWCRWACVYVCAWRVAGRGARVRAQCKWITRRARPARVTRAVETRRKGDKKAKIPGTRTFASLSALRFADCDGCMGRDFMSCAWGRSKRWLDMEGKATMGGGGGGA